LRVNWAAKGCKVSGEEASGRVFRKENLLKQGITHHKRDGLKGDGLKGS
jgi:hypothetical protein